MPDLTDRERETIDILTKSIVNKLLHHPIVEMRDADHGLTNTASARRLFGLHEAPAQVGEIVQVDPVDQRRAAD
jgi:glutamyl-tRNA reductase